MGTLNSDNIKTILKPFKEKIDNLVDKDNASVNNTISINNNGTIATLSAEQDSVKLSIGDNSMELNTDGELKVNGINVMANNSNNDVFERTKKNVASTYTQMTDIPHSFYRGSAVAIGTDIYLLGSSGTDGSHCNCKYDTTTNSYTKNTNIPYVFSDGSAVAIGTDIYLLGSANSYNNRKYDTTTNTYTQMATIPYIFYNGSAVAIGTDIYLLGGGGSSNGRAKYNCKYDTITNTYTQNRDMPYEFYDISAVAIDNNIYLLGSSSGNININYNYKYDTATNTYTRMTDIPYKFSYGSAVAIGTDIYLLGGGGSNNSDDKCNYKYDTTTDIYTQNRDIPYYFSYGSAVAIGTDIYLLGSNGNSRENYKYSIPLNSIIILKKSNYYIYTKSKSYGPEACMVEIVNDEYYTEYINNTIIKSTAPISLDGISKLYIKPGAILNGKEIPCESEGWQDINLLNYM